MTKLRCRNRENDKYIDGIRDLTVPRESGLAKNWARDAGFMFVCLSGMPETVTTNRFQRSKRINQTVRTRTGRQITLSYRALSSYWGTKSYLFLQKPLKTHVNSKHQSKGSTYMLHFLAFVEIRLFNVFFWDRKAGFGKLMKNVRNAGTGPPLPGPW